MKSQKTFKSKFTGLTDDEARKIAKHNQKIVHDIKDKLFAPIENRQPTHYLIKPTRTASLIILLCIGLFSCNRAQDYNLSPILDYKIPNEGKPRSFDTIFKANIEKLNQAK